MKPCIPRSPRLAYILLAGLMGVVLVSPGGLGARDQGADPPAAGDLPPGVVARVNGRDITVQEYSRFLLELYGKTKLTELVDRVLVEQEARRLGIEVQPAEVEKEVDEHIEQTIRVLYRGDRERFESMYLGKRHMSMEEYRDFLRQKKAYDLLVDRCVIATREVSEEDVVRHFEETYGEGGVLYELRHILVSTRPRPGATPPSDEEARQKAERILGELRAGAEFTDLVRENSDDRLTRRNDGRIPLYRKDLYGPEFHRAVEGLTDDQRLSDVVRSDRGYHIVYLIRKNETKLEEKREEILEWLKTRPPALAEEQQFLRRLRARAEIRQ